MRASSNLNPLYTPMAYEIDFLAVGDTTKSGDAIALRYGTLVGPQKSQRVVIIDGGFKSDGDALVKHVKHYYETDTVDLVISTHTDGDHVNGLFPVLEQLRVGQLWMHMPWKHSDDFAKAHSLGQIREATLREALKRSLEDAVNLEALARKMASQSRNHLPAHRSITMRYAFSGRRRAITPIWWRIFGGRQFPRQNRLYSRNWRKRLSGLLHASRKRWTSKL